MGMGTGVLDLPPAAFADLRAALVRKDAARRYHAMTEHEHLGVKTVWIGEGSPPPPLYDYDTTAREAYLRHLRDLAGIPHPLPTSQEAQLAQDRANWAALRAQRRRR
ncbi:hypothetical protein [Deinococcus multiflagellatus]|uniref:Uncharacterized protein n=1 Tax=Deinococcus multiflagellatus TaxID=1656887 RepID=A0ABW1ZQ82_9DEIO|nr:hypothetical protein [Deinococcus multiflagellatus]MBZ9715490.1 hypothetical protein [Deinococcus multiflagellatus]